MRTNQAEQSAEQANIAETRVQQLIERLDEATGTASNHWFQLHLKLEEIQANLVGKEAECQSHLLKVRELESYSRCAKFSLETFHD